MAFCSLTALMRINHFQPIFRVPEYAELSIHTGVRRAIRSGGGLALETARELQNALLPQQFPRFPSSALPEASALRFHHFFRPSSAVGGDFFQVFQISDSAAGVLICDVMEHGVRAALVAMILRTLVEDLRVHATEPAKFLQELNRAISHILKHTHLSIFVSALYLMADISRGELHYANAGHPNPLCVHRTRSAAPLPLSESKPD